MDTALPALYAIVDIESDEPVEIEAKRRLALLLAEHAAPLVQVRAKTLATAYFARLCGELRQQFASRGCRLIINDRLDVALMSEADGIHVGEGDIHPRDARALLGKQRLVGFSTHSIADVEAAQDCGADYLGFGPVFASPTKPGAREPLGLAVLQQACRASKLPIVAIGGITVERASGVFAAGAQSCAVISELARSNTPQSLITAYARAAR